MGTISAPPAPPVTAERVLEIVQRLVAELHPKGVSVAVGLDSSLERDLGFDSLSRVELLARIERSLGVSLPAQAFETIETPRDLLRAVETAAPIPEHAPLAIVEPSAAAGEVPLPRQARTLLEVLDWHARHNAERPHIRLLGNGGEQVLTCAALQREAQAVARVLVARDVRPGDTVAIMLPTCREYFLSFFGALYAGAIPVPIYPPARATQLEEHVRRHARILSNARAKILITVPEARTVARLLRAAAGVHAVITAAELAHGGGEGPLPGAHVHERDIAFLQYTSGSTGHPKGVILTHANVLANLRTMGREVGASPRDVFVSWLPLYHDMGLIGAWFGSLYYGMPLVLMSPLDFLVHPARWLWAIHRYRATISAAPNFAFELCARKLKDDELEGLDLSSLRLMFNGAESVSPQTLRRFSERFARCGLAPAALTPVYGLAECTLGLSFPPPGRGPVTDRVAREPFTRSGRAVPADPHDPGALEFTGCGRVLPDFQVRIVDETGHEVGEREEGRLEFQSPSATSGYFRNPEATRTLFHDGWLDSGDRAYLAEGELYITGRVKDVIIRAGRNLYPHELEERVGDIPGIRRGCVAVFGSHDPANGTERLIVLAETRETERGVHERLRAAINAAVHDLAGTAADEVVLAAPHTVLKTSSGKIRRAASRELFERGRLEPSRVLAWQLARLAWLGVAPELRRAWRAAAATLYAAWAWLAFAPLAAAAWLLVALMQRPDAGRAVSRALARLLLRLTGLAPRVAGLEQLPAGACVIVANHASYLDGLVLMAVLPQRFAFVAKREFTARFIPRAFLHGLGAQYVERFERRRSIEDAAQLARAVRDGGALLLFPEGTFTRRAGLMPFRLGAFLAAADAGAPLVPVALRGTRAVLRDGQWFPRRGRIDVTIGTPVVPRGGDFESALRLREAARAQILAHCGEPDLA
jgi:1-acyl-sn-glycerol-3-phosphate acyltransferase